MRRDSTAKAESRRVDLDVSTLEKIVDDVLHNIDLARQDIYDIADDARKEYSRLSTELFNVKQETKLTIAEVDELEKREKLARVRLMEVSKDFKNYSEDDIKQAYESAQEFQVELVILREKEKSLIRMRNDLELGLKRVEDMASTAEGLVARVTTVMKMLKGNAEMLTDKLEDVMKKQQLGMWIVQAQEEERKKIARDLHDGPAQSLANLVMRLDLIERMWDKDQERVKSELSSLKEMIKENISEVRRVIFDLRPMALDDLGLVPALKRYLTDYEEKYGLRVEFLFFGEEKRLDLPMETALFRLIQEAVTNTKKHAQTRDAVVKLEMADKFVAAVIKDDGIGFDHDPNQAAGGSYGLMGMKERVELFGGKFTIKSRPNHGTQITIRLPLKQGGVN
ncbi:MAG: sensor histidine kinase [Acidobacteriota bacterium]